jgi:hypothetical protein
MSEHNAQVLTEAQKSKILLDVHRSLVGDPLDPAKPGLVAIVGRHHMSLYGHEEKNGLVGDNSKYKRLFWVGTGIFITGQGLFTWYLAARYSH